MRLETMMNNAVHDLVEACRQPGCPVCRLEQHRVQSYLQHLFYENVNDVDSRHLLRQSLGFCREHTWQIVDERLGDVLGIAIIHQDLVGTVLERLGKREADPGTAGPIWKKGIPSQVINQAHKTLACLTPHKRCPACHQRDEQAVWIISSLMENIGTSEIQAALQLSAGICLPHFRLCLKSTQDSTASELLLAVQRGKMEALYQELEEFILKNDYHRTKEVLGKEKDSWLRAVGMITGKKN